MQTPFGKETYLYWYEIMLLMRRFEEKAGQLYGMQKIRGFCHLYIGQEAVAAGIMSATREDDNMITAYRDHGLAIAKGISADACMAELYGKATGCTKGKGGSMHFFSKEKRFFGGHGIVGAQIGLGAGIAFADQYQGSDRATICMFGDGAARQGMLHETFNMAVLWKLPVVFICENNGYAMGTSLERTSKVLDIYRLADAYDMPGDSVDGMSCEEVHKAIDVLKTIMDNQYATQEEIDAIIEKVKAEVEGSVKFAEESPYPDDSELYKDIYTDENYPFIVD